MSKQQKALDKTYVTLILDELHMLIENYQGNKAKIPNINKLNTITIDDITDDTDCRAIFDAIQFLKGPDYQYYPGLDTDTQYQYWRTIFFGPKPNVDNIAKNKTAKSIQYDSNKACNPFAILFGDADAKQFDESIIIRSGVAGCNYRVHPLDMAAKIAVGGTSYHINDANDYYFSINSFCGGVYNKGQATKDNVFALKNIVIDLDVHRNIDCTQDQLTKLMQDCITALNNDDTIPDFNLSNITANGCHLYFSLAHSLPSAQFEWLYKQVSDLIAEVIDNFLRKHRKYKYITIDRSVVGRTNQMIRFPGTCNESRISGNRVKGDFTIHNSSKMTLFELYNDILARNSAIALRVRKEQAAWEVKKQQRIYAKLNLTGSRQEIALVKKYIRIINELAAREKHMCEGRRNQMIYILYNYLLQANAETAEAEIRAFNDKLKPGLKDSELNCIIRCLDKKFVQNKLYKMRTSTLAKILAIKKSDPILLNKREKQSKQKKAEREKENAKKKREAEKRLAQGQSSSTIARELQIRKATVLQWAKEKREKEEKEKAEYLKRVQAIEPDGPNNIYSDKSGTAYDDLLDDFNDLLDDFNDYIGAYDELSEDEQMQLEIDQSDLTDKTTSNGGVG